jgi:hypothetical protein
VLWIRSPIRNFWLRGNFSTVGTSHNMNWYIASTAGPVYRAAFADSIITRPDFRGDQRGSALLETPEVRRLV